MLQLNFKHILNDEKISIGKRYEISGEIRYGIKSDDLKPLFQIMENIDKEYLSEVIVFDLTQLTRWDSLGIRTIIPNILKLNEKLEKKGRSLIGIIGDENSDLYAAAKDKHPDISQENLPWYPSYDEFLRENI